MVETAIRRKKWCRNVGIQNEGRSCATVVKRGSGANATGWCLLKIESCKVVTERIIEENVVQVAAVVGFGWAARHDARRVMRILHVHGVAARGGSH